MSQTTSRIPSLDGLRAISILLVIFGHSGFSKPATGIGRVLYDSVANGALGVSVFFVISGFLITRLLLAEERTTGSVSLSGFYMRRVFRIFPAYYAHLIALLGVAWLGWVVVDRGAWISSALFVRNYATPVDSGPDRLTAHFWSLAVEEQFYLFWPFLMSFSGPVRARRIAFALIVSAPLVRMASYVAMPSMRTQFVYLTHTRVDTLMFGCLAALMYEDPRFRAALQRAFRLRLPLISVLFLAFVSPTLVRTLGGRYLFVAGYSLEGAAITIALLWAVENEASLVGRVLNAGVVTRLGTLSYSLYLWHLLLTYLPRPWSFLAMAVAATISYRLIELPALELRKRFDRRRSDAKKAELNVGSFR